MPLASFFSHLSTAGWIDLSCLVVVLAFALFGAVYGLSGTLAFLLGLLLASLSAYWLYPIIRSDVLSTSFCKSHAAAAALLPYLAAFLVGALIFILLRLVSKRFFQLIIQQPIDRVLGILAGVAKGFIVLFFVFTCAYLLPSDYRLHKLFCSQTRTGRTLLPVIRFVLHPDAGK